MTTARHFGFALSALALPCIYAFADGSGVSESSLESALEQAVSKNKGHYTIFNPVPGDLLRELTPDRPDKTESPYTVDAGHFQLEMDFANLTLDDSNSVRTRAWNVAPFNIKIGLLNNVDLQFVFDDYLWVCTHDRVTGTTTIQSGVGDFTPRLKINVWGDDGGPTALGFLSFVKFNGGFWPDLCNWRKRAARLRLQLGRYALRRRRERIQRCHCPVLKTKQSLLQ